MRGPKNPEREQCAWTAGTLMTVKKPADAVHTRRPRWHLTLRAADLEEGAKESYHHGDRGGRRVSARETTQTKPWHHERRSVPGHRGTDVLKGHGAPEPLGLRALREG